MENDLISQEQKGFAMSSKHTFPPEVGKVVSTTIFQDKYVIAFEFAVYQYDGEKLDRVMVVSGHE